MEIKTYNSAQLEDLIRSDQFAHMPVIPISMHRAIAHIHNPRAGKDDVLMIIAYEGGEMAGYLGVLADTVYNLKGEAMKAGWLSCMWVNPALRGQGIAKQLLATAFRCWDDHVLVTEFTGEAKGLYDRTEKFNDLRVSHGLRCYLRFNLHEVLPKKGAIYKRITPLLRLIDGIANVPVDLHLRFQKNCPPPSATFEQVSLIDEELNQYILSKQGNSFGRRTAHELNWIIQYPWLLESEPTGESVRYHFSSVAGRFRNICVKLTDKGVIKGYIHLTIRDNHLKVPYVWYEPEYIDEVVQYIYSVMYLYRLNMLTVFHAEIVSHLSSRRTPFIYKRPVTRQYIITKSLDAHFSEREKLVIQDGDADCAFT